MSGLAGLILSLAFVAGVIGNLVASLIWATPAAAALARKLNVHHAERLAQAARHHREAMAKADEHQAGLVQQANQQHVQVLDRIDANHEALAARLKAAGK